ncbi:uncharacterized protein [Nicotiana sylvestris]|uniref:uncharacterized protein n=1 Tax=Nicotiana sylvestris TaxID=4096 RepID=UPI00388C8020
MQIWLQKRSSDFKPEDDLPVAPAWVLLPVLPFHMHDWHYIKQLLSSVGMPLALDAATMGRTRPSMPKLEWRALEKIKASQLKEEGVGDETTMNDEDTLSMNKKTEDGNLKNISTKEERGTKKRSKKKKIKKIPKKKSKEDNVVQSNDNALQYEDEQSSSNEMSREKGQGKEETPNIHVQEDNKGAKNEINREEEENRAGNCNSSSDTYTSTVPTEIRNLSGINFVVDLNCKERDRETSENSINNNNENITRGNDTKNEDIQGVSESREDGNQHIAKRGRSETRKSRNKSHRNRTHPSQRRKQREYNALDCSYD